MVETTKEANDVRRVTFVQDDELSHDLCSHNWLDVQCNQLVHYTYTIYRYSAKGNRYNFNVETPKTLERTSLEDQVYIHKCL